MQTPFRGHLARSATGRADRFGRRCKWSRRSQRGEVFGRRCRPGTPHLRTKYGDAFNSALREALQSLDDEQRLMLKLRVKDGLTLEQSAAVIGVHRSSVARRLAAAHETIWQHTKRELVAKLRIDPREFESVLRLVRSRLHLSLSSVL